MNPNAPLQFVNGIDYRDPVLNAKRWAGAFSLTDVAPAGTAWLWPGRIPVGNVTLLVSDPGLGKSLLTLDVAARITTGRPWPDETKAEGGRGREEDNQVTASAQPFDHSLFDVRNSPSADSSPPPSTLRLPPSSVLILNIEDHFANTIKPRLESAGADCSRITAVTYVPGVDDSEPPRLFALDRDISRLTHLFEAMPDIRLVIIDPITAFLGVGDQSNANVWRVLSVLTSLARRYKLAVLAVSHLRKKEGPAIHRTMGSLAFVAAARSVWTIAKDSADPSKRLLLPIKNNLAPTTPGLAFTVENHESNQAPTIRWLPDAIDAQADLLLAPYRSSGRPDDERKFATDWLRVQLSGGAMPMRTIREAADAHGISCTTLRRAFRKLGGKAVFVREGDRARWDWRLPAIDDQNPSAGFWSSMNAPANTDVPVNDIQPAIPSTLPIPHSQFHTPNSTLPIPHSPLMTPDSAIIALP